MHSLGVIRSRRGLPTVLELASNEKDRQLRESAIYALGSFSNARVLKALLSIAQSERETPRVRGEAIEQIGRVGIATEHVLRAMTALLRHDDVVIAFWAAYALGQVGDESVIPALSEAAAGDDRGLPPFGTMREEAARAIGNIRARRESADAGSRHDANDSTKGP